MSIIDTKNNDLKKIIELLWNHAKYGSFYESLDNKPIFDWSKGIKDVKPGGYIEYFCGKQLNITVESNNINVSGYDLLYTKEKRISILSCILNR